MTAPSPSQPVPGRPSQWLLAAEPLRAAAELALTATTLPLLAAAPSGDGHPVIVLPGFTAGDVSTRLLRRFLKDKGYFVHGWRLGANMGPTPKIVRGLEQRFAAVSEQHGQSCSVIGWSLGGTFARKIALDQADAVRQVITIGTPLRLDSVDQLAGAPLFNALAPRYHPDAMTADDMTGPVPTLAVPSTSIYSRSDGFLPWPLCLEGPGSQRESIEVVGSHLGLGHNAAVLAIVANRLAQPAGEWTPFADAPLAKLLCPRP